MITSGQPTPGVVPLTPEHLATLARNKGLQDLRQLTDPGAAEQPGRHRAAPQLGSGALDRNVVGPESVQTDDAYRAELEAKIAKAFHDDPEVMASLPTTQNKPARQLPSLPLRFQSATRPESGTVAPVTQRRIERTIRAGQFAKRLAVPGHRR